jgi:hypothetical protein
VAHNHWNARKSGALGGSPAPFTSYKLESIPYSPDDERLDNAT